MPLDRLALIGEQSQFYRNNYRRLLYFVLFLIIVAFILLGVIVYQHMTRPVPKYFATTSDGRLIEIQPLAP
jgi:intracellular multiplication protein IcmL